MTHVNVHSPIAPTHQGDGTLGKRLDEFDGKHIGLVDAMKPNAALFLKYIEEMLTAEHDGVATETVRKSLTPNMAVAHELDRSVEGVVVAWGD